MNEKPLLIKKERVPKNIMTWIEDQICNNKYVTVKITRHGDLNTITVSTDTKKQFTNVKL